MTQKYLILIYMIIFFPTVYFLAIMPYIARKTESFGVSIPREVYYDPEISKLRDHYRLCVIFSGMVLTLLALMPSFIFDLGDEAVVLLVTATFFELILALTLYISGHKKMKKIKEKARWVRKKQKVKDFFIKRPEVSPLWFLLHFFVIVGTLFLGIFMFDKMPDKVPIHLNSLLKVNAYVPKSFKVVFIIPVVQSFMTFVFMIVYWSILMVKQQMNGSNGERSPEQLRKFVFMRSAFIVFASFLLIIGMGLSYQAAILSLINPVMSLIIILSLIVLTAAGFAVLPVKLKPRESRLKA